MAPVEPDHLLGLGSGPEEGVDAARGDPLVLPGVDQDEGPGRDAGGELLRIQGRDEPGPESGQGPAQPERGDFPCEVVLQELRNGTAADPPALTDLAPERLSPELLSE